MALTVVRFCPLYRRIQAKALEAEVINLRKEIELMKNQHKVVDKQRIKAIQVKCECGFLFKKQLDSSGNSSGLEHIKFCV